MVKNLPSPHTFFSIGDLRTNLKGLICKIFLTVSILTGAALQSFAQAPSFSYSGPNVYQSGTAITPLAPTGSGPSTFSYGGLGQFFMYYRNFPLYTPISITTDPSGTVYVTSSGYLYSSPAGGGNATTTMVTYFTNPQAITSDAAGNLYVADQGASAVYKLMAANKSVKISIGSGFASPYGVAVDAAGNVYVADLGNGSGGFIKEILAGTNITKTLLTNCNPNSIALDDAGNIYFTDSYRNTITELPAGSSSPQYLFGGQGLVTPTSVTVDAAGNIFVGNNTGNNNGNITVFPANGGSSFTMGGGYGYLIDVYADAAGNIFVADAFNNALYKGSPSTGYFTSLLPAGLQFNNATGTISGTPTIGSPSQNYSVTAYNGSGHTSANVNIGVTSSNANLASLVIDQDTISPDFAAATTTYTASVAAAVTSFNITAVASDASATVTINGTTVPYATASNQPIAVGTNVFNIAVASSDGSTTNTYTLTVTRPLPLPTISYGGPQIYTLDSAITALTPVTTYPGNYGLYNITHASMGSGYNTPLQLAVGHDGTLYIPDYNSNSVDKLSPGSSAVVPIGLGGGNTFTRPSAVALDSLGNIYIADYGNKLIKEIPAGSDTPITLAQDYSFGGPDAIAVDAKGTVYVDDASARNIVKIPADRSATKVYSTTSNGTNAYINITALAVDAKGNVFVADANVPQLSEIPAGGGTSFTMCPYFNFVNALATDAAGNLYISDANNSQIKMLPPNSCSPIVIANYRAYGLAVDSVGNVYTAMRSPDQIAEISPVGGSFISRPLPTGLNFDYATGTISGTPTARRPTTQYTVTTYNATGPASATQIIRTASGDATLSALATSAGIVSPAFAAGTTSYTIPPVYNNTTTVTLTPTVNNPHATVTVAGNTVTSGTASTPYSLNEGDNTIPVTVTADNGTTTQTYNVTVHRKIAPPVISYSGGDLTFYATLPITPVTPTVTGVVNPGDGVDTTGGYFVTPALPAGLTLDNNTGIISGTPTVAVPQASYTITAYNEGGGGSVSQNITILQPSNDATLSNVNVSAGSLAFSGGTTSYTVNVDNTVNTFNITPFINNSFATATISFGAATPAAITSGQVSSNFTLSTGNNVITILVTAQDGITQQTYTLNIFRAYSADASLANLNVTNGGSLDQSFNSGTTGYTATISGTSRSIDITASPTSSAASITINGSAVSNGGTKTVSLSVGSNTIPIVVTAEDKTTTQTYTVSINRPASTNTNLTIASNVSGGNQTFTTNGGQWASGVPYSVSYIVVTPSTTVGSTFLVNGIAVAAGTASQQIPLAPGATTTYTVTVTAESGASLTYTFAVTRGPSPDATLVSLVPSSGALNPVFSSGTTSYTNAVDSTVSTITFTPTTTDANATIQVNGISVAQGTASAAINLSPGPGGAIPITVTAQSGALKTYFVTTLRHSTNLSGLSVLNCTLSPAFTLTNTKYNVSINGVGGAIYFNPVAIDPTTVITINGSPAQTGTPFYPNNGDVFNLVVTSQDGLSSKTYTITATVNSANLAGISLSSGTLSPAFDTNTTAYTATVDNTVSTLSVTPTAMDLGASITINNNGITQLQGTAFAIPLNIGYNTLTCVVTSGTGSLTKTYTITVLRNAASAPIFSYNNPNAYPPNVAISPLRPNSSSVYGQAYSSTVNVLNSGYSFANGIAADASGNVFVADLLDGVVYKTPAGGSSRAPFGSAIPNVSSLVLDAAGNIYAANSGSIYEITADGSTTTLINSTSFSGKSIQGIARDATGDFFVVTLNDHSLYELAAGSSSAVLLNSGFNRPGGVAVDATGNIYVADNTTVGSSIFYKLPASGSTMTQIGQRSTGALGIAVDAAGNVYLPDRYQSLITQVQADGGTAVSASTGIYIPNTIAVDPSGNIYFTDYSNGIVGKIVPIGGYYLGTPLPTGLQISSSTGIISGTPTTLTPSKNYLVTAYNGLGGTPASATILIGTADANLTNITIEDNESNPVTISPAFDSGTFNYTASVANSVTVVSIQAFRFNPSSTVTIIGPTSPTSNSNQALNVGSNLINIVVTSPDGTTSNTYTVNITRAHSSDANLANIYGLPLTPTFDSATLNYTSTVNNGQTYANIYPVVEASDATITVNGQAVVSYTESQNLPLNVGNNAVTVVVTAGDGVSQKTYTLNIIRSRSSNTDLATININPGVLSQQSTYAYSATVGLVQGDISVNVATVDPGANIAITSNGTPAEADAVPLNVGINTVDVIVTASDSTTTATYVLTITRSSVAQNTQLSNLEISPGTLTPSFDSGTNSYTVTLPAFASSIALTPTASDISSSITINGSGSVQSGGPTFEPLNTGSNTFTIIVYSSDRSSQTTYTITVSNPAQVLPAINYTNSTQVYNINTTITPLTPVSSLVANATGYSTNFNTISATLPVPGPIARDAAGNLYTIDFTIGGIYKIPAGGGTPVNLDSTFANQSFGIAVTANGTVYATNPANDYIEKIAGTQISHIGSGLIQPAGIAVDAGGNLYFTCVGSHSLYKIAAGSNIATQLDSNFVAPYGIALDNKGNVYVTDIAIGAVIEVPAGGGADIPLATGLNEPVGMTFDAAGNLFVAELGSQTIGEIPATGDRTPITIGPALPTFGLVADPSGNIFATNFGLFSGTSGSIIEISPAGGYTISPELPTGLTCDNTTGTISGKPTVVSPATLYTITGFNADGSGTAVVNITVKQAAVGLASLRLNPYSTLKAVSVTDKETDYTTTTPAGTTSVTVTPKALGSGMNITVNGSPVTSNTASAPITLNADGSPTIITTVVTAPTDTVTYVVTVNQVSIHVASLTSIVLNPYSTLQTVYATATTTNYSTTVPAGTTSVTVTPKASGPGQVIYINGSIVASGTPSAPITLNSDFSPTVVQARVYAPDGTTVYDYLVTINQVPMNNANLTSIALDPHSTLKAVASTTTETDYTTTAPAGTTSVTVTAKASDPGQTITVGGNPVTSDTPSAPVTLNTDGTPTVITTVVTAPDGVTTNTYVVSVSLPPLHVASLSSIVLNPYSTLKVTSATATETDYTTTTPAGTTSVTVTPKASGSGQTITVDGAPVVSGTASGSIALNSDGTPTTITTVVTALDGTTTNTYVITVNQVPLHVASLTSIVLNPHSTLEATSTTPTETDYTTTTPLGTTSVTVTPKASGSGQTITVDGAPVVSGTASGSITLNTDFSPTVITTVVTAPDGTTTNTYVITVKQVPMNVASLTSIVLSPHSTLKAISVTATETDYTTTAADSTTSVTVTPKTGAGQTITVDGTAVASGTASAPITLNTDGTPTIITTVVTAPDGTTTNTYVITINKASPPPLDAVNSIAPGAPISDAAVNDGIVVHQALSPNGDGINDVLTIDGLQKYSDNKLAIMNSNGVLVFSAQNYDNVNHVFDGHSNKGVMQAPGTYFYILQYKDGSSTKTKTGFIVLKY
jgi:gliding motility-associated-like protein